MSSSASAGEDRPASGVSAVDFSRTAADYATHRAGFPDELFRRLAGYGLGEPGQRVVDLGTGTGSLGRGLARRGARVTGVDLSAALMAQAERLDRAAGLSTTYVLAPAEATGLPGAAFDVVTAGQCWHWFDRPAAAAEARRLLAPGGRIAIATFDWIPMPGSVVIATEALIEEHNPAQPKPHLRYASGQGIYPLWLADLAGAGFERLESWSFDGIVTYSREAWRGRIRASQGVGASLPEEAVRRFDEAHDAMLRERFPVEPYAVPHRVFVALGDAPR